MYTAHVQMVVSVEVTYINKDASDTELLAKAKDNLRNGKNVSFTGADRPHRVNSKK